MKWLELKQIYCLLTLVTLAEEVTATPNYRFDVWQTDDGLPQSTVTSIVQTHDGYLWLGTQNGLVRFDGINFKVFDENNTPAIKNDRMVRLFADRRGALWISGEQGKLICLRSGQFVSYDMPGKGTAFNYAREMCDDAEGRLWIVSCEWQMICHDTNGFTVPSANWNLTGVQPDAVAVDQAGEVWVGTERELAVLRNGKLDTAWSQANEEHFAVDFLATSRDRGGVWVAANGRIRKFKNGQWVDDRGAYAWTNSPVYDLYEDSHSRIWVATMGSGLFRYDPGGSVLRLAARDGLPTDFVRCVTEDREGNMWVGMEGGGLCRLKPSIFQALGAQQGLSSDQVMSACESTDGSYWIGMNGDGLDHLFSDGKVEHYGPNQGLMNGHVWSVFQDREGTIGVGTWDGFFKFGQNHFVGLSDGIKIGWEILAIHEDDKGNLWLGQQGLGALVRLHDGECTPVRIPGASSSLDVRVIVNDSAGDLWVGTESDGLFQRRQNGQWAHFGKKQGLESETVWSLRADDDGSLWIGTCGGGLSRWQNGKMTTWTTRDGLINDVICQILEDDHSNLWLGSYGGVFCVNKKQLAAGHGNIQCTGYDKADGLPSIECVGGFQPSGLCSSDRRLWFPTVKGFAIVDPNHIPHDLLPPQVVIDGAMVDENAVLPRGDAVGADTLNGVLKVPPGNQRLEFRYTALSLTDPDKLRFKYRLEGFEEKWNDAETKRTADYSHLPPGQYQFHVIACNNDGVWNDTGATLAVNVSPYFWQTRWFEVLATLAVLGSVAGSVRYFVKRKLQRRIDRIERERAIEAERGRIANDIHDELGAGLTEIVILGELVQNPDGAPDTAQADVRKIMDKARALTQALDEIVWAVNLQNDTLDNFVTYACDFAQDYLRLARIRCRLDVPASLPEFPLTSDVRHNLFMVLKETLNNIVKHSNASEVGIQIAVKATQLVLCVKDNGKGLEMVSDIAGLTEKYSVPGSRRDGLANMRKRIKNIGGQFELRSAPGLGITVEVVINLQTR